VLSHGEHWIARAFGVEAVHCEAEASQLMEDEDRYRCPRAEALAAAMMTRT
jgi:hypothetical protein